MTRPGARGPRYSTAQTWCTHHTALEAAAMTRDLLAWRSGAGPSPPPLSSRN